jgi:membrane protease YdiL (CAAX protease family)
LAGLQANSSAARRDGSTGPLSTRCSLTASEDVSGVSTDGQMNEQHETPPEGLPGDQLYRIAWVFYLFLAIGGAIWVGARNGRIEIGLFFDPAGWWLDLGLGVAAGGLLLGLWQAGLRQLPVARELEDKLGELLRGVEPAEVIALALLSGFAEELFFRGAVQGAWGWPLATLLFALLHVGPGAAFRSWTVFAGVAGLLFAGLMEWRGNLLAPVVAHVLVNAINLGRLARRAG